MLLDDKVEFKKISNIDDKERALVEAFSSGKDHIDSYLKNEALEDLQYGITKTYLMFVTPKGKETYLLGFFSLTTDRVLITKKSKLQDLLTNWKNPVYRKSIPGIQIHHFAVNEPYQAQHLGQEMMYYAFLFIKTALLSNIGACLITVQSEPDVRGFYESLGFCHTGQVRDSNVSMAIPTNEFFIH
ncbi:GNAT family N-acetyltransferase [Enterococcus durans]